MTSNLHAIRASLSLFIHSLAGRKQPRANVCQALTGAFVSGSLVLTLLGCGNLPFAQKSLPTTEPVFAPPPPAAMEPVPPLGSAPVPSPGLGATPVPDSRLADLASQVETLRVRLQAVEGKLAEQEHQLQQWQQTGGPQQSQTRDRLLALERELAAVQERLVRLEGQRLAPAPRVASPPEAPPIREVPPPPAKPGNDPFGEGMTLYKKKSYAAAREQLQQFLKEHPKGDKASEARYYLADCFLQEKKYDEAIVEFNRIVETNPKSALAPAALLKQSQAFKAQGKTKVANLVLEKLLADYPKSPEAAQARKLQGQRP